ncbi:MAG: magnesium chelatase domain-containing protein, partial [Eubacteriales bacterium]|nr:magnesium chelatase domain-containing protein [Eubacteriales bacterium]
NVPYDLSDVMFICTANTTDTIPEPLLNRMEVIRFTGYTPEEKLMIAKEHLLGNSMEEMGIKEKQLTVPDETIEKIISEFTMEAGVRGLRKRIDTLCRSAAVKIAEKPDSTFTVKPEELRKVLDMHPVHHDQVLRDPKPGVVTGLAWTQVGGEILYIESLFTKGSGKLIVTGQLGDVMKESVQIAVSLVKEMFPDKAELFEKNDLHIHVPEGAVPKDGPSAGITLTTAVASLVSGHPVDPTIAMTGEVALRGAVTPIGGLPEKLMAADRAGVKKVFIPKDNVEDLKDVAEDVREHLTIVPVTRVEEVLKETGIL